MIEAKIIADSISEAGIRITTLQLCYPRFIHAEFMTHRVFSRNASSSRAIPVSKMIEQVRTNPAMPIHWGQNQPGMQASQQIQHVEHAKDLWCIAANKAADLAESMHNIGLHKQVTNRILEPFQHIHVVITSTEWENFFALRMHPDAQPEIMELAIQMKAAMNASIPKQLLVGKWHLPYVDINEGQFQLDLSHGQNTKSTTNWELACKVSAARCCRVSYLKHDGHPSTIEDDLALCDRLAGAVPIHASPFEHQATPDVMETPSRLFPEWKNTYLHGNFIGWIQYRKRIEMNFQ